MTTKAPDLFRWRSLVGVRGDRARLKMPGRPMEGPASERTDYVPAIDGLRAVAVLSVLAFHLRPAALPGGFVGVDVFFVISGFVVTKSLYSKHFSNLSDLISYFYVRRILRIIPALIVMLLVSVAAFVAIVPQHWLSSTSEDVANGAFFGVSNIVLSLQTDDYFAERPAYNPFTHTWSLGVEEQFYLIFPFLLFWYLHKRRSYESGRSTILAIGALSAASLLLCAWLTSARWPLAFYLMPARLWELGAGMLLCLTIEAWLPLAECFSAGTQLVLACASVGAIASVYPIPASTIFPFPLAILPAIGTVLVIVQTCALPQAPVAKMLSRQLPVAIGKRSYSLYLWHWPVFVFLRWTVGLESVPTGLVGIIVTFLAAEASYRFVELGPLRRRIASSTPRWIVIGVGLALIGGSGAVASFALRAHGALSLSRTAEPGTWYGDGSKPMYLAFAHCQVKKSQEPLFGGTVRTWTPGKCSIPKEQGRLIVLGDSHSLAYIPILQQFSADTGRVVRSYHFSGCPYVHTRPPNQVRCGDYNAALHRMLLRETQRGDVVFFASVKMPTELVKDGLPRRESEAERNKRISRLVRVFEDQTALSRALEIRGVNVVLEGPKPTFRSSTIMCSDWFNRGNPECRPGFSVQRAEMEAYARPIVQRLAAIARVEPNVLLWDPFPLLCPSEVCHAYRGGKPLYIDGHHVSAYANELLYPSFRRTMRTAFSRPLHQTPRHVNRVPSQAHKGVSAHATPARTMAGVLRRERQPPPQLPSPANPVAIRSLPDRIVH